MAVMARSFKRVSNAMIALVTAIAWFLAANHCALANFVPPPTAVSRGHEHCGGSSDTPADQEQPNDCDGLNCCKSLSAPASFAKKLAGYDKAFYTLKDYVVSEFIFLSEQHDVSISELDTGPPPAHCFAEAVLQRSLLAHAPPSLS
jgi:hypothetical protein